MPPNKVEDAADAAEHVRLAYVATTRARDHLVLSLFRKSQRKDNSPAGLMEQFCGLPARPVAGNRRGFLKHSHSLPAPRISPTTGVQRRRV